MKRPFNETRSGRSREEIKLAFNAPPGEHALRILIATDAAREGLNLQRHCRDLFHLDLPWNPSRLEQRNGRIDRKLQPAEHVYCRYFVYAQRPEDRVLRRLVGKTEIIRKQLGSASPVIETRISELLAGGIERSRADQVAAEIDQIEQSDKEHRAREDLEPVREADGALTRRIEQLRSQLERSSRRVGVDRVQLERVVTYGGAQPAVPVDLMQILLRGRLGEAERKRERIRTALDNEPEDQQRLVLARAEQALADPKLVGDAVIAAFFSADRARQREEARQRAREQIEEAGIGWQDRLKPTVAALRGGSPAVVPFHWPLEFPEVDPLCGLIPRSSRGYARRSVSRLHEERLLFGYRARVQRDGDRHRPHPVLGRLPVRRKAARISSRPNTSPL